MPWNDPTNDKVGNILLSRMMGADSRLDDAGFDIGIRDSWKQALEEVEAAGGKIRKVRWLGRDGAPDRRVLGVAWIEVKRPGGALSPRQVREIDEMRRCGERVEVISTFKEVDDFVRSVIW